MVFGNDVECCVCGEISNEAVIASTNGFGSDDLDTRPPEMERSTIEFWIHRCPSCGYCSPDISKSSDNTKEIVGSKEYKEIIEGNERPVIAASFLALSYEREKQYNYAGAAWNAIHAAWFCDDKEDAEGSIACRKQAVYLIEKANEHKQKLSDKEGASEVITIDLMRRSGMYQEALKLAERIKQKNIDENLVLVIEYEEKLITQKDLSAHTVSEVLLVGEL
jgi:hypothetical protein